jgi:hypothetical protein
VTSRLSFRSPTSQGETKHIQQGEKRKKKQRATAPQTPFLGKSNSDSPQCVKSIQKTRMCRGYHLSSWEWTQKPTAPQFTVLC